MTNLTDAIGPVTEERMIPRRERAFDGHEANLTGTATDDAALPTINPAPARL
ncbi:MAG: hypothetical protein H0W41_04800 [Chloroflexi bacterium]|nr:hypothetical protein [Chloroflexota bacterium]